MLRPVQDRTLPLDHGAFVANEPPTGRVIVIAPTRAACETIEIGLGLHLDTYLERTQGTRLRELARSGRGFGIVAGTGTGKTLAIRPIAEEILRAPLNVGVVNREREATPELDHQNAIIVTTGIARRWFQDGDILPQDTLVIDEIHQTSAELELCLALGKRVGCRFIWLSATVDPSFYRKYLNSADVLEVYSFDPAKAAQVKVIDREPVTFLNEKFLEQVVKQKRGVGIFLPTRASVEQAAAEVRRSFPQLNAAFYHGGEPIRAIRPFLEDEGAPKPYLLAMTAAGQSALNVRGLDTVIIDDTRFANVIENGRNVLTRLHLGSNEILQMAGRVHGRVENGRVFILSNRDINFARLRPTPPDFQLAGDSERVALTCADLGVRADELELPVPLNKGAYRLALRELQKRGIITENGRLSKYGKAVEALPVDRVWAELIVNAEDDLVPYLAVMSSIESLHRMTREENSIGHLVIPGSDHLTTYNLYADAYEHAGYEGKIHGLPRHLFEPEAMGKWAEERGVLVKAIEDAALAMAGIFRSLNLPLPSKMPLASEKIYRRFTDLVAKVMPFDLVINEETADVQLARVSKSSVCSHRGAIAGTLRYFADRNGVPRASIEGTQIPREYIRRYAKHEPAEIVYDKGYVHAPLVMRWRVEYFGFELESGSQALDTFSPEIAPKARHTLAEALARGDARHNAVAKNNAGIEEIREMYRRSGGQTRRLNFYDLTAYYEAQLNEQEVNSLQDFRAAQFVVNIDDFVSSEERKRLRALPVTVPIRNREVEIAYDVETLPAPKGKHPGESVDIGVIRLRLPEKLARTLITEELPEVDRPLRFVVSRGSRGAIHAETLEELQEKLEGPWTPDEGDANSLNRPKPKLPPTKPRGSRSGPPKGGRPGGRKPGRRK